MYSIKTTLEISAAHQLRLNYGSPCSNLHGHNWIITVFCRSDKLDSNGMVLDFARLKRIVKERYDHQYLNDRLQVNPTAENIAFDIANTLNHNEELKNETSFICYRVDVQETDGNTASWELNE